MLSRHCIFGLCQSIEQTKDTSHCIVPLLLSNLCSRFDFPRNCCQNIPTFHRHLQLQTSNVFLAGAILDLHNESIVVSKKILFFLTLLFVLSLMLGGNLYYLVSPFALSYGVIFMAIYLPFSKTDQYGDFSYGIYIYAFPIQQFLSFFRFNQYGFTAYFVLSMILILFLSIPSWFLVEKPSLAMKKLLFLNAIASKKS